MRFYHLSDSYKAPGSFFTSLYVVTIRIYVVKAEEFFTYFSTIYTVIRISFHKVLIQETQKLDLNVMCTC